MRKLLVLLATVFLAAPVMAQPGYANRPASPWRLAEIRAVDPETIINLSGGATARVTLTRSTKLSIRGSGMFGDVLTVYVRGDNLSDYTVTQGSNITLSADLTVTVDQMAVLSLKNLGYTWMEVGRGAWAQVWDYTRDITFTQTYTNHQTKIVLDDTNMDFGHANVNGDDIRFFDGATPLPYWIESWNATTEDAVVWVKVPDLTHTVNMKYGSLTAGPGTNGAATFERFASLKGLDFGPTLRNAVTPTYTPTYDGGNEVVHPSIVDFGGSPWNGVRYWMAYAPYTATNSQLENPSIVVSSDGLNWNVPAGLTNPIWPAEANRTQADPDLVYDPDSNKLRCYWLKEDTSTYTYSRVLMLESADGVTWTGTGGGATPYTTYEWNPVPQNLATMQTIRGLSPSIVRVDATHWYMWTVIPLPSPYSMYVQESADGYTWGAMSPCDMTFESFNAGALSTCWHLDVNLIGGTYYALMFNGEQGLSLAKSSDRVNWTNSPGLSMLVAPLGKFDDGQLYRSTFTVDTTNDKMRVWYTSRNHSQWSPSAWRMGYTEGTWSRMLATIDGNEPTFVVSSTADLVPGTDGLTIYQGRRYTPYEISAAKTRPDNFVALPGASGNLVCEVDVYDFWGDQTGVSSLYTLPCAGWLRVGDTANLGATEGQEYEARVGFAPNFTSNYVTYYMASTRAAGNYVAVWTEAGHGAQINYKRTVGWKTLNLVNYGDGSSSMHTGGVGDTVAGSRAWLKSYGVSDGVTGVRSIRAGTTNYNIPDGVRWAWKFRNLKARKYQATDPVVTVGAEY